MRILCGIILVAPICSGVLSAQGEVELSAAADRVESPLHVDMKWKSVGTDPAKRAFYRAFRDLNTLNDLGIE